MSKDYFMGVLGNSGIKWHIRWLYSCMWCILALLCECVPAAELYISFCMWSRVFFQTAVAVIIVLLVHFISNWCIILHLLFPEGSRYLGALDIWFPVPPLWLHTVCWGKRGSLSPSWGARTERYVLTFWCHTFLLNDLMKWFMCDVFLWVELFGTPRHLVVPFRISLDIWHLPTIPPPPPPHAIVSVLTVFCPN